MGVPWGTVEKGSGCRVLQRGAGKWWLLCKHGLSRTVQLVCLFLYSLCRVVWRGGNLLHRAVQYTPHLLTLAVVATDHLDVSVTLLLVLADLVVQCPHLLGRKCGESQLEVESCECMCVLLCALVSVCVCVCMRMCAHACTYHSQVSTCIHTNAYT